MEMKSEMSGLGQASPASRGVRRVCGALFQTCARAHAASSTGQGEQRLQGGGLQGEAPHWVAGWRVGKGPISETSHRQLRLGRPPQCKASTRPIAEGHLPHAVIRDIRQVDDFPHDGPAWPTNAEVDTSSRM